jgi:molybdopterin molybdotransferase
MPEFLDLLPPKQALERYLAALPAKRTPPERVATENALGRVLAEEVRAPHPLPPFARTTVDGYAVRAQDTHGASGSLPAYLKLAGEVRMGKRAEVSVARGQAALVHTGGMMPPGADAVVMVEDTQQVDASEIEVLRPVASGENVLQEGEDVARDEVVLESGTRLRPQEIGGLMALGFTHVLARTRPRVGILSTGDEVVPPEENPKPGQVRDVNSYTLAALVEKAGGIPIRRGIIPDERERLATAAQQAHAEDDLVVITAGSSVSTRDLTADVITGLGAPGVLVHGISIRPGKPTILGLAGEVPVIGLPGNPVSAMVVAGLFVNPLIRKLMAARERDLKPSLQAQLTVNVASEAGREDHLPVRIFWEEDRRMAEPVFGRSNLIFTLVRADGLVRIAAEATGLPSGKLVDVQLF